MIASPLQMLRYFITDCQVTAAKHFKSGQELVLDGGLLVTEPDYKAVEGDRRWEITLRTKFQPGPGVNTPYLFVVEIVGFFEVVPNYPRERVENLVKVNGPSMLYGVTREVVRDLTSRGPHPQMFLPSASFMSQVEAAKLAPTVAPPPVEKRLRSRQAKKSA